MPCIIVGRPVLGMSLANSVVLRPLYVMVHVAQVLVLTVLQVEGEQPNMLMFAHA